MLENLLVFIAIPLLVLTYGRLRLTNTAYTLLFVFFVLHELGAHYTYSEVPYDSWAQAVSGHTLSEVFGLQRNHYDRSTQKTFGIYVEELEKGLPHESIPPPLISHNAYYVNNSRALAVFR